MAGELILIVEDNEKNRKLERDVLQFHGYRILEAVTGEEGVRLARETPPALILMDIQLPGMSGIEALDPAARRARHARHSRDGGHRVRDDPRPPEDPRRGLRRLPVQAHQREGVRRRRPAHAGRAGGGPRPMSDGARILVVDDTPLNVKLLADLLRVKGYRGDHGGLGPGGARADRRRACRTSCSST